MRLRLVSRLAVISLVVVVALIAILHQAFASSGGGAPASHTSAPTLQGGADLHSTPAPAFSLTDEQGQSISLAALHGHIVILTFMDATCTQECPIVAQFLDQTAQYLGAKASQVEWLAMSVNPNNKPSDVYHFLTKNNVQIKLHYLLGSQSQLSALWKAYHIAVIPSPTDVAHTSGLYLIDQTGHERMWFDEGFDTRALAIDIQDLMA
ncbi:MAG TPA: SCO family protein [Ktedonobacterales bacterium]|nr:SCO family protein [Ktedonobacterales bacterium]